MKSSAIARRYAKALFQLAQVTHSLDEVLQSLSNICLAMKEAQDFSIVLRNPLIQVEDKYKIAASITSNKLTLKVIELLAKRRRTDLIPVVYQELSLLTDATKNILRASVKTPSALSDEQKKAVEFALSKALDGRVIGKFDVARELLGGIWVKIGDKVLDATLKGRIEDLRQVLVHSTN